MLTALVVSLLALANPAPPPDVLPVGSKGVRHELVLERSPHFSEHDFFAAPVRGFGGCVRIVPGEPFTFSSKYRTRIYALALGSTCPDTFEPGQGPSVAALALASGDIPVAEVNSVHLASPTRGLTTRLRIAAVSDSGIQLEVLETLVERDMPVIALVGTGLVIGVLGLVVLGRRRRRAGRRV